MDSERKMIGCYTRYKKARNIQSFGFPGGGFSLNKKAVF